MANKVHYNYNSFCFVFFNGVSFMPNISVLLHLFTIQIEEQFELYKQMDKGIEKYLETWEQPPVSEPQQMCDWDFNRGTIPRCSAYFPTAAWRSGYATGGQRSWWKMPQSKPFYSRRSSILGVQGGRISKKEEWKRNKQMHLRHYLLLIVAPSRSYPFPRSRFIFWCKKQTDAGGKLGSIPLLYPC